MATRRLGLRLEIWDCGLGVGFCIDIGDLGLGLFNVVKIPAMTTNGFGGKCIL